MSKNRCGHCNVVATHDGLIPPGWSVTMQNGTGYAICPACAKLEEQPIERELDAEVIEPKPEVQR